MALAHLAHQWTQAQNGRITTLTVDHKIRDASSDEAKQVASWMSDQGIAHVTLSHDDTVPESNIEAWARELRYRLMTEWCKEHHVLHLLVAHHLHDQIETFLLRVQRGSSPFGLACMPEVSLRNHVRILRPLLQVEPAQFRHYLESLGQAWIHDESNNDMSFRRNALRNALSVNIEDDELTQHLQTTIQHAANSRRSTEHAVATLLAYATVTFSHSALTLDIAALHQAPQDIQCRALQACLQSIAGDAPIRHEKLLRLHQSILDNKKTTLAGCTIEPKGNLLYITQEHEASPTGVKPALTSEFFGCQQP